MFTLFVIGEKGNLLKRVARQRAKRTAKAIALLPAHDVVELSIYGYDDDPREIWDIPETRDYFIAFVETLVAEGIPTARLLEQTQQTVKGCYAAREGTKVVTRGTPSDTIREGIEQALAHIRRNVN